MDYRLTTIICSIVGRRMADGTEVSIYHSTILVLNITSSIQSSSQPNLGQLSSPKFKS